MQRRYFRDAPKPQKEYATVTAIDASIWEEISMTLRPTDRKWNETHHTVKPLCLHGSCQAPRANKSDYCEFHAPYHKKKVAGYSPEMLRKMMAGR